MDYLEFSFTIAPIDPYRDILMADLAEIGFESFVEVETGLQAYIPENEFSNDSFEALSLLSDHAVQIDYTQKTIKDQNWNVEWEKNFHPIYVRDQIVVRATFHNSEPNYPFQIVIDPKQAFGTGHHETTWLMLDAILRIDVKDKTVLDMGCGTGILGILAALKSASRVVYIDNDPWSYENSIENCTLNGLDQPEVILGEKGCISGMYDLVIANINRNALVDMMPELTKVVNPGGTLLLSGLLIADESALKQVVDDFGLTFEQTTSKGNWICMKYSK